MPSIQDGDLLQMPANTGQGSDPSPPDRPPEIDVVTAGQGAAECPGAASDRRAHQRVATGYPGDRGPAAGSDQSA